MSSKATSFVDSAASAGYPMSRQPSIGAELGRLALTGRGSSSGSDMPATTRGAAKREAAAPKQSSSQAAPKGDKGKQRASASSAKPSRQQPRRLSKTTRSQQPDPDDDDDDSDDSDSDGDAGDPDANLTPAERLERHRKKVTIRVFKVHLIFEPSQHSFMEMATDNLRGRSEASTLHRNMAVANANWAAVNANFLDDLERAVPVEGRAWSRHMVDQMKRRWNNIHKDFYDYCKGQGGADVQSTIQEVRRLFGAVEDTIAKFPNMSNGSHTQLVEILIEVFETLVQYPNDTRPPGRSISFAGGASNHEHNLWLHFAAIEGNWGPCLQVIGRLGARASLRAFFKEKEAAWIQIWRSMQAIHNRIGRSREVGGFVNMYRDYLAGMGVNVM